jgi:hypothetical protein
VDEPDSFQPRLAIANRLPFHLGATLPGAAHTRRGSCGQNACAGIGTGCCNDHSIPEIGCSTKLLKYRPTSSQITEPAATALEPVQFIRAAESTWPCAFNGVFRSDLPDFCCLERMGGGFFPRRRSWFIAGAPAPGWKQRPPVLLHGQDSIFSLEP